MARAYWPGDLLAALRLARRALEWLEENPDAVLDAPGSERTVIDEVEMRLEEVRLLPTTQRRPAFDPQHGVPAAVSVAPARPAHREAGFRACCWLGAGHLRVLEVLAALKSAAPSSSG
ncbi:hypothetical protein [Streptomyces uncialis]|uniref:Uncharacterized protein n=1 Tax=Streptomyces uncialis TaxID=1048205 RepID=A0A1Q4V6V6_9ACTN|nr:hypothetical protein [Streptomyces uncialis]OKH93571.1 hypothetical protein AB852_19160 [Streptomyces uncialis]